MGFSLCHEGELSVMKEPVLFFCFKIYDFLMFYDQILIYLRSVTKKISAEWIKTGY